MRLRLFRYFEHFYPPIQSARGARRHARPGLPGHEIARQGLVAVECVRAHAHVGHHPAAAAAALKGAKPAQDANWRKVRKSCRKTFKASFEQKNRPTEKKPRSVFLRIRTKNKSGSFSTNFSTSTKKTWNRWFHYFVIIKIKWRRTQKQSCEKVILKKLNQVPLRWMSTSPTTVESNETLDETRTGDTSFWLYLPTTINIIYFCTDLKGVLCY